MNLTPGLQTAIKLKLNFGSFSSLFCTLDKKVGHPCCRGTNLNVFTQLRREVEIKFIICKDNLDWGITNNYN